MQRSQEAPCQKNFYCSLLWSASLQSRWNGSQENQKAELLNWGFCLFYYFLILNRNSLLLLTYDILSPFHHPYKSCETRPVWGARTFPALWHFAEELLFFFELFSRKRRISKTNVVYILKQILYHIVFKILYCILYEGNRETFLILKERELKR